MNHRAQVRAAQDHVLRDSLAGSSLSALTLVVGAMLAVVLLRPPTITDDPVVVDIPRWVDDFVTEPEPPAGGGGSGGELPAVPAVLLVDEGTRDSLISADPFEPLELPGGGGSEEGDASSFPGAGGGPDPAGAAIPSPDVYIVHDEIPQVAKRVDPQYPGVMRDAGLEGRVRVRIFVGTDGRVKRAEIEGDASAFDEAALAAIRQWVFTPAKSNGHPVAVWMRIPVVFRLD